MPQVASGTFTTPAGTGVTQVISGLDFQPKALLVWGVRVTDETVDVDTELFQGMTDGVGQTALAIVSATASANTQRFLNESATLMIVDTADTDTVVATFSAWETDGVSLNFSVTASGYVVHYIAMGGDDSSYEHFAEVANTSPVSGLGFQPDGLVAMCLGLGAGGGDSIHAIFAPFGVVDDAGNEWWLASFHGADANTNKDSEIRTGGFIGQMYIGAITWEITHTAWTSDGFTYGGTTNVDAFYGIAMNTGAKFKVGTFTKPTGTAPQDVDLPDLGINPTGYLLASGSEINEAGTTPRNARVSIGVTDGVLQQNIFTTGENSANNQDQRQDNDAILRLGQDAASPASVAVVNAIVDATPTITFDPNDTQAIIIGVWEWEADAGATFDETGLTVAITSTVTGNDTHNIAISIASVTPSEFDMDAPDIDIVGTTFEATQNTGSVYLSDATTLAGSSLEVDLTTVIGTWADTSIINIDLSSLSGALLDDLHTLGPGARFIIVQNDNGDEVSSAVTLHRPHGFSMVASANINDAGEATAGELTAPAGKSIGADFGGGRAVDIENPDDTTVDLAADEYREDLWNMEAKLLSREVLYQFRVVIAGTEIGTYTVDPRATVQAGETFNETGLTVPITSGVSGTDVATFLDSATVAATSTVVGTDVASLIESLTVAVTSTVTGTEGLSYTESLVVAITSTVTGTDTHFRLYDETGKTVAVTSTVTGTDVATFVDSLTAPITSTVTGTDTHIHVYDETGGVVAIVSTVVGTDTGTFSESLLVAVVSTVTGTDTLLRIIDETGLVVAITSAVTGTDVATFLDSGTVTITSGVTGTDAATWDELGLTVAITSTVTSNDGKTSIESLTVNITSTVTGTDVHNVGGTNYDETGLLVAVISSVTGTDALTVDELGLVIAITSTVAGTDTITLDETGLQVDIISTVTGTDQHQSANNYDETGKSIAIISTVVGTDVASLGESLVVAIISTVVGTEAATLNELGETVAIVSVVTGTDVATFSDSLTVAITSTVTGTDTYIPAQNFDETGLIVAIASSVSGTDIATFLDSLAVAATSSVTGTDVASFVELGEIVAIVSTVTGTEGLTFTDSLAVAVVATVSGTDLLRASETTLTVAITATVTGTDTPTFGESLTVAIIATVTGTDDLISGIIDETGLVVNIVSAVTSTDTVGYVESGQVDIFSTVTGTEGIGFTESGTVNIISTVTGTDGILRTESLTVNIVSTTSGADFATFVNSGSVAIVSGVTGTDVAAYIDSATIMVVSTVIGTDAWWDSTLSTGTGRGDSDDVTQAGHSTAGTTPGLSEESLIRGESATVRDRGRTS